MIEIKAPNPIDHIDDHKTFSIFLAGSNEMGAATEWRDNLVSELKEYDVTIFNPRQDNWDPDIKQTIIDSRFNKHVNWELDALDKASLIVFYFDPNTKSPVTLLELGLFANKGNVIVCCPDMFWQKGIAEIVCKRHSIKFEHTFENLVSQIKLLMYNANVPRAKV